MEPLDPDLDAGGPGDTQPGTAHGGSGRDHTDQAFRFDGRACLDPLFAALASRPGNARTMARNEGEERRGATRNHARRALAREHGEGCTAKRTDGHRTFPEVSTMAHSTTVGGPGRRRSEHQSGGAI
jgi:hypothetical protein